MPISSITSILTQEFLAWISRNRITFIIIVLLAANVYQYMDGIAERKAANDQLLKITTDAIEYEHRRSEKLEFLIRATAPSPNTIQSK